MKKNAEKKTVTVNHTPYEFLREPSDRPAVERVCTWRVETLKLESMRAGVKTIADAIEGAHNVNAMDAGADDVREWLPTIEKKEGVNYTRADAENFLISREKIREQIERVNASAVEIDGMAMLDFWDSLADIDRNMITLINFPTYTAGAFDKTLLYTGEKSKKGADVRFSFKKPVEDVYAGASNATLKEDARAIVNRFFGATDGKLFHGMSLAKAQIDITEFNHLLAMFGGFMKRDKKTGAVYYVCNTSTAKVCKGLTTWVAVLMSRGAFAVKADPIQDADADKKTA